MPATTLTVELTQASVSISSGFGTAETHDREEVYVRATIDYRGKTREVSCTADRYEHSSGWSDWRVSHFRVDPGDGIGEKGFQAIREATTPVVLAWIESDAYAPSRATAFARWITRRVREERYSVDSVRRMIARNSQDLTIEDNQRLTAASDALERLIALTS